VGITIERQLPERGDRGVAAAPAGQCCCCCCCCLHTVGSIAGALSARPVPVAPEPIPASAIAGPTQVPRHSATGLYWAISAILSGLTIAYFYGLERDHVRSGEIAVMMAMLFPGVQLAASVIAVIAIASSKRPGKNLRLRHLGKITLRAFLGAVVGTLIMLPMFGRC
jgi:hypothetical protein